MFLPGTRAFPANQLICSTARSGSDPGGLDKYFFRIHRIEKILRVQPSPPRLFPGVKAGLRAMEYHERHGHDVCSFDLPSTRT